MPTYMPAANRWRCNNCHVVYSREGEARLCEELDNALALQPMQPVEEKEEPALDVDFSE